MPTTPSSLYMTISQCSCICGNKWTHSTLQLHCQDGSIGGQPSAAEEHKLQVTGLWHLTRTYSHCWRCAPLGLGVGWQRREPEPAVQPDPLASILRIGQPPEPQQ